MTQVRITQTPKSAMQSGRGKIKSWRLEVLSADPILREDLMGWVQGPSTANQIILYFDTYEAAHEYGISQGWSVTRCSQPPLLPKSPKSYADNFKFSRRR